MSAFSKAQSMSPLRIWRRSISPSKCGYQLPHWWTLGASESNALRTSVNASRSSNSMSMRSTASAAVASSSAATIAIGWPL